MDSSRNSTWTFLEDIPRGFVRGRLQSLGHSPWAVSEHNTLPHLQLRSLRCVSSFAMIDVVGQGRTASPQSSDDATTRLGFGAKNGIQIGIGDGKNHGPFFRKWPTIRSRKFPSPRVSPLHAGMDGWPKSSEVLPRNLFGLNRGPADQPQANLLAQFPVRSLPQSA